MDPGRLRPGLAAGLAALVLFAPLIDGGTTYVPATVIRLGALALAATWLAAALGRNVTWRRATPVDLPVVLFMLVAGLSALASAHWYESLQGFLGLATGALVLAVGIEASREPARARWVAGAVVAIALAEAGFALAQRAAGADRPAGTWFNPNHLALSLAMATALLLAHRPVSRPGRAIAVAAVGLLVAAIIASRSRGGILALAVAAGVVGVYRWRWRAVAAGVLAALCLVLVPNPLAERLRHAGATDPLLYARVKIWESALERTADHPLGVGVNLFRQSSQRYAFPVADELARYGRRAESAHNDYLEVLAELGIPGLVLALWGLVALGRLARRAVAAETRRAGQPGGIALGSAGALAAVAAQAAVDSPLGVPGLVVHAAALAGVLAAAGTADEGQAAPAARPFATSRRPMVQAAVVAAGLLAALGVARHGAAYLASQRAVALREAGDLSAARLWLARAAHLAPESAGYADAQASAARLAWRRSGDPAEAALAERLLLRAIELDPEDSRRYVHLAQLYVELTPGDPGVRRTALRRARDLYLEAERLDPHAVATPFERAEVHARLDDPTSARAALERALALEPRFLPARLRLARLLAAMGDRQAALEHYAAIEATFAEYETRRRTAGESVFARTFLAVDRAAARREAGSLERTDG